MGVLKVLGGLFLVVNVFLAVVALAHRGDAVATGRAVVPAAPDRAPAPLRNVDLRTLREGQCYINDVDPDLGAVAPCTDSHDGEVIGAVRVPGAATSDEQVAAACRSLVGSRLVALLDEEVLTMTWSLPRDAGSPVVCRLERGPHEPSLVGSLT